MSVICIASLKGGVGKTSLSINLGHALAQRGCKTLLADLDPSAHASRYVRSGDNVSVRAGSEAALARLILSSSSTDEADSVLDRAIKADLPIIQRLRDHFDVVKGGSEMRHFYWGSGARSFRTMFPALVDEFRDSYDYVVLDTAPDLNVVSRNAIASADIVIVPVDSSIMSIHSLEEIVSSCSHIQGPIWCIVRTMVNRRASKIQAMTADRLHKNVSVKNVDYSEPYRNVQCGEDELDEMEECDIETMDGFVSLLRECETEAPDHIEVESTSAQAVQSPIYLLNSIIYRTENQNRLSFLGRTCFDRYDTRKLADQYIGVAREVEEILAWSSSESDVATSSPDVGGLLCSGRLSA